MSEFKGCPFCGGAASMESVSSKRKDKGYVYLVKCIDCRASICGDDVGEALAKWNARYLPEVNQGDMFDVSDPYHMAAREIAEKVVETLKDHFHTKRTRR